MKNVLKTFVAIGVVILILNAKAQNVIGTPLANNEQSASNAIENNESNNGDASNIIHAQALKD